MHYSDNIIADSTFKASLFTNYYGMRQINLITNINMMCSKRTTQVSTNIRISN